MIGCEPVGAEALLLVLADQPSPELSGRIRTLAERILKQLGPLIRDWVAGWTTLLLHYDLCLTNHQDLEQRLLPLLRDWLTDKASASSLKPYQHELAVYYDGPDLAYVAEQSGLSVADVIQIHSSTLYWVGAVGFAPGFAYLGTLDQRLVLPRRSTPRLSVPAGSLAIAERQTAIYPQASPGGWHLLGRCLEPLFDPDTRPPVRLQLGDRVRFVAVDLGSLDD